MHIKIFFLAFFYFLAGITDIYAQYPVFSQFFASPLSLNPALAGNSNSNWRVVGNQRSNWIADGIQPLTTTSLSVDAKLIKQKQNENNYLGGGLLFSQDQAIEGAYKNTTINAILSSHVSMDEDDNNGLSIGIGANYNTTFIDFSALTFSQQLSSSGFNRSLPSQETSLSQIKPYLSMLAGVTYNYSSEFSAFEIGFSGYRFIKTYQSALNASNQIDPPMYNLHMDFQTYLTDKMVLSTNGLYTSVNSQHFYSIGMSIGNILDNEDIPTVLNTGLWLRNGYALVPYIGLSYKNVQGGLTYDISLPSAIGSLSSLRVFEFSLMFTSTNRKNHPIPCPWK